MTTPLNPAASLHVTGRIGNVVYQYTKPGSGNVPGDPTHRLLVYPYRPHNTSHTPAQQAQRNRFRAAATAWDNASDATKAAYRQDAKRYRITGYNLFIKRNI